MIFYSHICIYTTCSHLYITVIFFFISKWCIFIQISPRMCIIRMPVSILLQVIPKITPQLHARLQICPLYIFGNNPPQIIPSWIYTYWFPGFGFDSGPNLQPCHGFQRNKMEKWLSSQTLSGSYFLFPVFSCSNCTQLSPSFWFEQQKTARGYASDRIRMHIALQRWFGSPGNEEDFPQMSCVCRRDGICSSSVRFLTSLRIWYVAQDICW